MNKLGNFFSLYALKFLLFLATAFSSPLVADLLINPNAGTVNVLFDDSVFHDDDVSLNRALGFTGAFFGVNITTVDVSTNGNLNFTADDSFFNLPLPFSIPMIAPFWEDLRILVGDGASIIETVSPGVYYAVTWNNMEFFAVSDTFRATFQVAIFNAVTEIDGCTFLPGDIVFSYEQLDLQEGSATVGLNFGDTVTFAPALGTTDGEITTGNLNLLPLGQNYMLFRPDGLGNYNVSIVSCSDNLDPNCLKIKSLCCEHACHKEICNEISWTIPRDISPAFFLVIRDGKLVGGTREHSFQDCCVEPGKCCCYTVLAVFDEDNVQVVGFGSATAKKR